MKKFGTWTLCLLAALVLVGCSGGAETSPDPQAVFSALEEQVALPELVDMTDEYLEMGLGIDPNSWDSAVCYLPVDGTQPDEIIMVRATDSDKADDIRSKLEDRLGYKEKSAQLYLTENMPVIEAGVVRQDGLTVSLIVSEQAEEICGVLDSMS